MTTNEIIAILLAIIGFMAALSVKQLISIAKSVNDIKVEIGKLATSHDDLKERVVKIEDKVYA